MVRFTIHRALIVAALLVGLGSWEAQLQTSYLQEPTSIWHSEPQNQPPIWWE
jgi:hypothetical protein